MAQLPLDEDIVYTAALKRTSATLRPVHKPVLLFAIIIFVFWALTKLVGILNGQPLSGGASVFFIEWLPLIYALLWDYYLSKLVHMIRKFNLVNSLLWAIRAFLIVTWLPLFLGWLMTFIEHTFAPSVFSTMTNYLFDIIPDGFNLLSKLLFLFCSIYLEFKAFRVLGRI